jgi:hypothetical protein
LTARRFATSFGLTFPILRDPSTDSYRDYWVKGISPYPRDCIIDQAGIVRYLHSEYDPYTMNRVLNELLLTDIKGRDENNSIPRNLNLRIYPNPTNSHVKVEFDPGFPGEYQLMIYDISGRRIYSQTVQGKIAGKREEFGISLSGNSSGIYFITLQSDYQTQTKKLILVR